MSPQMKSRLFYYLAVKCRKLYKIFDFLFQFDYNSWVTFNYIDVYNYEISLKYQEIINIYLMSIQISINI